MREDNLNGFKNKIFSINKIFNITLYTTPYTSPDATHRLRRRKTSRLNKNLFKKIQIKNEIKMIKNINSEIFNEYFGYQKPSSFWQNFYLTLIVKIK